MTITTIKPEQTTTVSTGVATLVGAVKDALRAVYKRPQVPIMSCVRVHAELGYIIVSGFDYETSITRTLPAEGEILPFVTPALALRDALARLDQKRDVSVSSSDGRVTLAQGTRIVTLKTYDVADFPNVPRLPVAPVFECPGATLAELSSSLSPFVSKDDMLPVLTAVNLALDGETLHGRATDRYRAAIIERPVTRHGEEPLDVLVLNLDTVAAVMGKDERITVHLHEGTLTFESDGTVITQRLLDGQFPRLAQLFPSDPATITTFEPVGFLSAVKFVEAGCGRNTAITVTLTAQGIHLESPEEDGAKHEDHVPAEVLGDDLTTGFNPQFLTDAVKVFGKGHDVVMSSTQGTKPSVFESDSIPNLRVLLMPRKRLA